MVRRSEVEQLRKRCSRTASWLMTIGNQACQDVDKAVNRTAVRRVLNLRDILELIDHTFDDGTFAQQEFIDKWHKAVFHVAFEACDQVHTQGRQHLLKQRLRDITAVCDQLAK
jgi:hypothetical protein